MVERAGILVYPSHSQQATLANQHSGKLWQTRIEAASFEHDVKYHIFISGLYKCQVELNRKVLADLAIYEPKTFKSLAALAKRRGEEGLLAAQGDGKEPNGIFSRLLKCA